MAASDSAEKAIAEALIMSAIKSVTTILLLVQTQLVAQEVAYHRPGTTSDRSLLDQPARLSVAGISLREALKRLRETSGVPVVFSSAFLPLQQVVNCACETLTVRAALDSLLADTDLQYFETRTLIVIEPPLRPAVDEAELATQAVGRAANPFEEAAVTARLPLILAVPTLLSVAPLNAQQGDRSAQAGNVSGTVVDAKTPRPLADAVVVVEGSTAGARTGVRGEFRLTGLSGSSARLRVTHIGYQPLTQEVRVGGPPVQFELTESIVKLDELVVTGTAGEAQKRTLGNNIGRV